MENEIWKSIKGYEGLYEISNIGRVKSFYPSTKILFTTNGILKNNVDSYGYLDVFLSKNGGRDDEFARFYKNGRSRHSILS